MASPVADSYNAASGATIYGGRTAPWPTWRLAMAANTWAVVPSNTLSSINAENNVAINPNYPSSAPWHAITGFTGITSAWNGMAWDEATATAWLPLQGGHADWGGNEPYKNCFFSNSPAWSMVRNPTGAIGNTGTLNDGLESSGVFFDGRLRPGHSYNNNIYVPGVGPLVVRIKGPYFSGATDFGKVYKIHETTGEATLVCDLTSLSPGQSYGGAVYDAVRNRVLSTGAGNTPLIAVDMTTGVGSIAVSSNNYVDQYARMVILPAYDLLLILHNGGAGYPPKVYLRELSALGTRIDPTITGSYSAGLTLNGQSGACWDDVNHRLLIWNNATNRTEISTLTPSGNPRTQSWTAGTLTVSGSNAVTPSAAAGNGTYGRFVYSPKLGGCLLWNATGEQPYFFATE